MGGLDDSRYFVDKGGYVEEQQDSEKPVLVPFPVCLAIRFGDNIRTECPDFVLNIEKSWVFIKSDEPLPVGTSLMLHFYIPPEDKLLAEVKGRVIQVNNVLKAFPKGMLVHFSFFSKGPMRALEAYFERKKLLVDRRV